MELLNIPEIKKWLKEGRISILIGAILILVGIFLLFCGYSSYIEYTNDEYEIISYVDKNNRTWKLYNRSLYLDTTIKPVFIGKDPDNTRNGYYLFEIDEFGYVVYANIEAMDSVKYGVFSNKYYGVSKKCNYEIQDMIINYYNKNKSSNINRNNFKEYISIAYIDVLALGSSFVPSCYMYGVVFIILGFFFVLLYFIEYYMLMKSCKSIDSALVKKIMKLVDKNDYYAYDKYHILLFDKYLIYTKSCVGIIELDDIVAVYDAYVSKGGHVVTVVMKDSEKNVIAQPYLSYKNILDEFYKDLSEKNKDISVGVSGIK